MADQVLCDVGQAHACRTFDQPGSCFGAQPGLQDAVLRVCHFHQQRNCPVVLTADNIDRCSDR